jgi:hypothetical protein
VDRAVAAGQIGVGERVAVLTRRGHPVAAGAVLSTAPVGLVVRDASGAAFFAEDVYLFVPVGPMGRPPRAVRPVRDVLREARAEAGDSYDNALSAEGLPADIQQAVAPQAQFTEDGVQKVLDAVGEAALAALKRAGVPASDLYGLVDKVQGALGKVLTQYAESVAPEPVEGAEGEEGAEEAEGVEDEEDAEGEEDDAGAVDDAAAALDALGGR